VPVRYAVRKGRVVVVLEWVSGIVCVAVIGYLLLALARPERF